MRISLLFAATAFAVSGLFGQPVEASVDIHIDKSEQRMTVKVDGDERWSWPVSTGRPGFDTPNGRFRAFRLEEDHYSREWDDAPMPHSIFFTKVGHAIHGTDAVKHLGRPASAGCVRLSREHAAKLFALVQERGVLNATVEITGDIGAAVPLIAAPERGRPAERERVARAPADDPLELRPLPAYPPSWREDRGGGSGRVYVLPPGFERPDSYRAPRVYAVPPGFERPRAEVPRRYDEPRAQVYEEVYINGRWVRRRYAEPARAGGPAFCRSGEGHPVFGRRWCVERGFGLGEMRRDRPVRRDFYGWR